MASKEIDFAKKLEAVDPETGEIVSVKAWAAVVPRADPDEYANRIVEGIFSATSIDQAMTIPDKADGLRAYVGKVITIHDARWSPSAYKAGPGAFYLLDITVGDEIVHKVVSSGATNVMAVVARAHAKGELPRQGRIVEVASKTNPENKIQYFVATDNF
jgi:hypothetical protein